MIPEIDTLYNQLECSCGLEYLTALLPPFKPVKFCDSSFPFDQPSTLYTVGRCHQLHQVTQTYNGMYNIKLRENLSSISEMYLLN